MAPWARGAGPLVYQVPLVWDCGDVSRKNPYSLHYTGCHAYGGFVFVFLHVRWFRVISLVSPRALDLSCGGFVFAKLTTFLEF